LVDFALRRIQRGEILCPQSVVADRQRLLPVLVDLFASAIKFDRATFASTLATPKWASRHRPAKTLRVLRAPRRREKWHRRHRPFSSQHMSAMMEGEIGVKSLRDSLKSRSAGVSPADLAHC